MIVIEGGDGVYAHAERGQVAMPKRSLQGGAFVKASGLGAVLRVENTKGEFAIESGLMKIDSPILLDPLSSLPIWFAGAGLSLNLPMI